MIRNGIAALIVGVATIVLVGGFVIAVIVSTLD